jgi:hypothetical protein
VSAVESQRGYWEPTLTILPSGCRQNRPRPWLQYAWRSLPIAGGSVVLFLVFLVFIVVWAAIVRLAHGHG